MSLPPELFAQLGDKIFSRAHVIGQIVRVWRFSAMSGIKLTVCAKLWDLLHDKIPLAAKPKHHI